VLGYNRRSQGYREYLSQLHVANFGWCGGRCSACNQHAAYAFGTRAVGSVGFGSGRNAHPGCGRGDRGGATRNV